MNGGKTSKKTKVVGKGKTLIRAVKGSPLNPSKKKVTVKKIESNAALSAVKGPVSRVPAARAASAAAALARRPQVAPAPAAVTPAPRAWSYKHTQVGVALKTVTSTSVKVQEVAIHFEIGDHAVYPGHGVGEVVGIERKEIMGSQQTFYLIRISETGMKIMVPMSNVRSVGLRRIISKQEAGEVLDILKKTDIKIDNQTWNRRYREYMEKIKTGSVFEIAEVLRDLFLLKVDKDLSFGERKMLDTARTLLIKELALATREHEESMEKEVREIFGF